MAWKLCFSGWQEFNEHNKLLLGLFLFYYLKKYFMHVCFCLMYNYALCACLVPEKSKEGMNSPELELQLGGTVWVPRIEAEAFVSTVSAFNN